MREYKYLSVRSFVCILLVVILSMVLLLGGCKYIIDDINNYLNKAHRLWNFDGSVLIAWKGRIVFNRSYGFANEQLRISNKSQTKFFIGSLTKQFTAALILILEQEGRLRLDEPIGKYLDGFNDEVAGQVTIHQLLTHSSGLPDYVTQPEYFWGRSEYYDSDSLVNSVVGYTPVFDPGSDFLYSNTNYLILGAIIEEITGQSYEAFLHHRILKPLKMDNSGYGHREAAHPNRAAGYTHAEFGQAINALPIDFSILHSAGAIYSTIEDILKWDRALYSEKILKSQSILRMFTPYLNNYGYGWFIGQRFGMIHYYHGGLIDGFNTYIDHWPKQGLFIAVFSNDDLAPVKKIARGIAAICFARDFQAPVEKTPIEYDFNKYKEYQGVYKSDDGEYRIVNFIDSLIYTRLISAPKQKIYPQAPDTFFFGQDNTMIISFDRNNNDVIACEVSNDGEKKLMYKLSDDEADRILINRTKIELDSLSIKRFAGKYLLESEIDNIDNKFTIEIFCEQNNLFITTSDYEKVKLFPNKPAEFFHPVADLRLTFIKNERGEVSGCILRVGLSEIYSQKLE